MKKLNKKLVVVFVATLFMLFAFAKADEKKDLYKCLIQMSNYSGEGAYVVVSLLDAKGNYVETLNVKGDDKEWFNEVDEWWRFYGKKRNNIDAITGATIAGGQRAVAMIAIDKDKINKGYKLRFESAVEDRGYSNNDVEIILNSNSFLNKKIEGRKFIRYVKIIAQN